MNEPPILQIENLTYSYNDGTTALEGVDLVIPRGSRVIVMGPNGSGKSTLFLCLNGVLTPSGGTIRINGEEVSRDKKGLMKLRRAVGIVFQDPDTQIFSSSVWNEVAFGPINLGLPAAEVDERVNSALVRLNISDIKDRPPHFLSGGTKKRVSIADILAMKPEVILFDEPTAALDPYHAAMVGDILRSLHQSGCTLIVSTHDVDRAVEDCDIAVIMYKGKIVKQGLPEDVFRDRELLHKANLHVPAVYEMFDALRARGVIRDGAPRPRSVEELLKLIG